MAEPLPPGLSLPCRLPLSTWNDFDWSRPEDMHMHTTYVDGSDSVAVMAETAASLGLSRILFTEHIRADSTYFPDFEREIRAVRIPGLTTHVGVETKVCSLAGDLDIAASHATACDAVIGSVHRPPAEFSDGSVKWNTLERDFARKLEFDLALAIVEKSQAPILGHPMGMYMKAFREVAEPELRSLAEACAATGKAFEINTSYCPDPALWVRILRDAGCLITIASDAHTPQQLGNGWRIFEALRHG